MRAAVRRWREALHSEIAGCAPVNNIRFTSVLGRVAVVSNVSLVTWRAAIVVHGGMINVRTLIANGGVLHVSRWRRQAGRRGVTRTPTQCVVVRIVWRIVVARVTW